jgi:hypothetical protein
MHYNFGSPFSLLVLQQMQNANEVANMDEFVMEKCCHMQMNNYESVMECAAKCK